MSCGLLAGWVEMHQAAAFRAERTVWTGAERGEECWQVIVKVQQNPIWHDGATASHQIET